VPPGRVVLFFLALALALAGAPRTAGACEPAPPRWPRLAEPLFEDPSVDVDSERIDLDCRAEGRDAACSFTIALRVRNASEAPVETTGAVLTAALVRTVEVLAPGPVAVEKREAEPFLGDARKYSDVRMFLQLAHVFRLALGGGEARDVSVRAAFVMERFVDPCFEEGVEARHATFAVGRRSGNFELRYFHSNAKRKLRRDRIAVHVRRPARWKAAIDSLRRWSPDEGPPERVSVRHGAGVEEASASVAGADSISVELSIPGSPVWGGGPFAGSGYWFGPSADRGPRLRLGYELAAPVWILHALAVETDAHRVFDVIPASELVSSSALPFPFVFGIGAGVPVRMRPDHRAGADAEDEG
jgi:hypothetical protein